MVESAVQSHAEIVVDSTEKKLIRVLHVDDELGLLKVAKQCLELQGPFHVDTAGSVEEALAKLEKEQYDAVVSDYRMPGKDGLEFLKELRESGNSVPFIMFTGKGREEVAIRALNLGANQYLNKTGETETVYTELAHTITELAKTKKAEELLRLSEERYKGLFENARDVIVLFDLKGNVISVNKGAEEYGFNRSGMLGKNMLKFISKRYWPKLLKDVAQMALGKTVEGRIEIHTPKGDKMAEYRSNPIFSDNRVVGIQTILEDTTERKKAEEVLQKSEETFKTLMEEAPIGICNTDLKGKITYVNKRFEEATGYSREEIVGKNGFKSGIMSNEISKSLAERIKERLMGKPRRILEGQFKRKDGEWIWAEVEGRLIKKFGVPVGFQLTVRDITERKRAEKERKRYEERLSALHIHSWKLNTAESIDEIYRLTLDAMEKTLGFEMAFFMVVDKDTLRGVDHRGYPEPFFIKLPLNGTERGISVKVAKTGKSINVPDAEKEDAWVEFMPGIRSGLDVPVKIGHKVLGVIGVDSKELNAFNEKDQELLEILASHAATAISNLNRAGELEAYAREIRESQQMFERLFIDDPEAAVHLDSSFHILNVNPRFSRLFDYSLDEVKGRHINDIIVPKAKIEEAIVFDERASKGEVYHEDTVRKGKDGSLVSVALSAAPIIIENQVIGHIAVYKDISQLKKAEDELRKMLQKLDKMNEKLRVVGGLTRHDVRNKLSTITGNAYVLKKQLADNKEVLDKIIDMETAVSQVTRIFDFAKDYEMLGVEELTYIDVQKSVNEAVQLFSDLSGVRILNECHGLTVLSDSLLRQLFYNLIDNSLKYGKKLSQIRIHYKKAEGHQLRLIYEDDGVGISQDAKPKLFSEGYTAGKGSGYGLYLVKRMMEVYGWTIQETGTPGKGVHFTIVMPEKNQNGKENYQLH